LGLGDHRVHRAGIQVQPDPVVDIVRLRARCAWFSFAFGTPKTSPRTIPMRFTLLQIIEERPVSASVTPSNSIACPISEEPRDVRMPLKSSA
ncbi:hypothetical protein, partial [Palleronia sp.]|uniref:hypothetical protein n=1 Tax=Palleronia sp. TaxID=1940284 RepID=UPI0035C870D2